MDDAARTELDAQEQAPLTPVQSSRWDEETRGRGKKHRGCQKSKASERSLAPPPPFPRSPGGTGQEQADPTAPGSSVIVSAQASPLPPPKVEAVDGRPMNPGNHGGRTYSIV